MKDFFISYTTADRFWAEWIAWELEAAGFTVIIQAWDFRPGENFVVEMQRAASEAERTVLVLTEDYLKSAFALAEWTAAFAQDPTGTGSRLVPVRVKACEPGGLLRAIIFIDLVGLGEEAARERLREGVQGERAKPDVPPAFPGMDGAPRPAFPGGDLSSSAEPASLARRKLIRASFAYAATTGLVLLASWMGLLGVVGADDWLERHFLRHMQRFLHPPRMDDIVLLRGADDPGPLGKPGPSWRGAHADLVEALSRAGARVIVFDMHFEERSEFDERFAEAIRGAADRNTSVVVGAKGFDLSGANVRPRIAPVLAALPVHWGILAGDAAQRRIELARRIPAAEPNHPSLQAEAVPVVPSLALQAVMQYDSGPAHTALARLRRSEDVVEVLVDAGPPRRRVPVVDSRLSIIVDVASDADLRSHSYPSILAQRDAPQALTDFAGKVVVIGFETADEVWADADGRERYEMEIQASAIAQLLGGSFLRRPGPASQFGLILLMGGIGWLLRARFQSLLRHSFTVTLPTIAKPVVVKTAFLVVLALYAVLAFAACKLWRIVPRFTYDVAALLLTYLAVGAATRGPFGPPLVARLRRLALPGGSGLP
jgi:CHASE2 domain-containing sensor protein